MFEQEIPLHHGRHRVFQGKTVTAGGNEVSRWFRLYSVFSSHGGSVIWSGTGTLKLEYKIAPSKDQAAGNWTEIDAALIAANDSPLEYNLDLNPNNWICFRATETGSSNDIADLDMFFFQTGKGA